jgi:hypothetical protein
MSKELIWLPDVLGSAGLPIEVAPDFATWARPYPMDLWGGIWHHTASPIGSTRQTNINVVHAGNTVAPGPIAQILSCREQPRLYLVSAGYSNNAGKGWWPGGTDSGNKRACAMEWINNGVGEIAHPESVEVSARAWAAIFEHMGWPLDRLYTHHAYAPDRKIDPAAPADFTGWNYRTWTLADVRGQVARYMTGDDMSSYQELADEVRQLDTRWDGFNKLEANQAYPIGKHAVIPSNATSLVMNVTAVQGEDNGFIKVWKKNRLEPQTSKVNFESGPQAIANMIVVGCEGGMYVIKPSANVHVVIDLVGYFV